MIDETFAVDPFCTTDEDVFRGPIPQEIRMKCIADLLLVS